MFKTLARLAGIPASDSGARLEKAVLDHNEEKKKAVDECLKTRATAVKARGTIIKACKA